MKNNGSFRLASTRLQSALATLPKAGLFAAFAFGASALHAATYTWDTDSVTAGIQTGSGTWSTATNNWGNGTISGLPWAQTSANTSLHNAVFSGTDAASNTYTITLGTGLSAGNLLFSNTGYQLTAASAQTLNLNNSGDNVIQVAAGKSATIGNNVTVALNTATNNTGTRINLNNGGVLNIVSGATVTRNGAVFASPTITGGTLGFMGNGTINVAGTLSYNPPTANSSGGIVIAANNGNLNTMVVDGGTVSSKSNVNGISLVAAGGNPAAATSGTLTINSGLVSTTSTSSATAGINLANGSNTTGVVNLNGGTISTYQVNSNYYSSGNALTTGGNSTFNFNGGTLKAIANNANFMAGLTAANVKSGGALIDSNGFNVTIGQALRDGTGGGGLTKSGNGTLTLSGASTYTGTTNVNVGTLAVNGSLASNIAVASGATLSGTGSTTGSVVFNDGSALTVNPADSFAANGVSFAGNTTLNFSSGLTANSVYTVVDFGSGSVSGQGNIIKTVRGTLGTSGSLLQFTAGSISTNTWNTASGTWQVSGTTPWSNGSDNEFWSGDTVIFDDTPGSNAAVSLVGSLAPAAATVNSTNNYTWSGSGSMSGNSTLTKSGSGSLTLGTANTYSGVTTLNAGTLVLDNASAIGSGALNIAGGALDSTTGVTLSTNNAVNLTGDVSFAGTNNLNLGNGVVTLTGERSIDVAANTLTTGRLVNTSGGLTKTGAGVLQLNPGAISSLNGTLTVSAGTLGIGAQDLTATGLAGGGTIQNGSATTRWMLITNTTDNTFSGVLQDGGVGKLGFSKSGAGVTTLGGVNTLSDVVTINDGTLNFSGSGSIANASSYVIATNGVLQVSSSSQLGSGLINISSAGGAVGTNNRLEISGGSTLGGAITLAQRNEASVGSGVASVAIRSTSGTNTLSGNVTVTVGGTQARVQSDSGSLTLSGAITTNATSARNLYAQGAGNGVISGVISDNAGNAAGKINFIKEGAGAWSLTGNNTYTGTTTVSAGSLFINGSQANGTVTVASGATLGGSGTIGGATTVNGILSAGNSPGVLSFTGNLTLGSGSTSLFEINGLTRGTEYDGVNVGGALTYGGSINLVFGAPVAAGVYDLFGGSFTSQSGDFSSVSIDGSVSAPVFTVGTGWSLLSAGWQYDFVNATGDLTITSAIPEPSAFAAFAGLAGLGLAGLRRRRRA